MFAQLGNHIFQGIKSPHSWDESNAARYGKIPLVNGKDVIQHTGEDLAEINLSLRYSVEFCDPAAEIAALKKSMKRALILPFITGEGEVIGNFVITGIDVTNEHFSSTGLLEMASVSLKLMEHAYSKKPKAGKKTATTTATVAAPSAMPEQFNEPAGEAMESADPVAEPPLPPVESPSIEMALLLLKGKEVVDKIKKVAANAKKNINNVKRAVREARQLADRAKELYTNVKTKVENAKKIIERAKNLPTSLNGAIKYAEDLSKIDNLADMSVLQSNVAALSESSDKVKAASAQVVAFSATREGGK
ncbi:MAG: phage tail protein [Prevotellaceae bacterium]|jgi:phage protein U/uncharacterized protein YoxC|nr:phage tail protein [Prevotellaceae bacterium]